MLVSTGIGRLLKLHDLNLRIFMNTFYVVSVVCNVELT
jgi:hypothetical protein